jgi:RES domain
MPSAEYATYRTTHRLVPIEHSNAVESVLAPDVQRILDRLASSTGMLTTSKECRNANINQDLANHLLYSGSNGIVYPSVRNPGGTSIVCFRPALV